MVKVWIWIMLNLGKMCSKVLLEEFITLLVLMSLCVIETADLMNGQIYAFNVFDSLQQLKWLIVFIIFIAECTEMIIGRERDKTLKLVCLACASVMFLTMEYRVRTGVFVSVGVLLLNLITFIFEKKIWRNRNEKEKNLEKSK